VTIEGLILLLLHAFSACALRRLLRVEPHALPLIIAHGWPGSVVKFMSVIDPLISPAAE
jgi:transcriptional regulator with PAS, ATPase and Fis domain